MTDKLTPKNVGSKGLAQSRMKAVLQEAIRRYRAYRQLKSYGFKCKAKIRMVDLRLQQIEINKRRKPLGLKPIRFIQELEKYLKKL